MKNRSQSERRMIKLQKIGFQMEAKKLQKQYNNKQVLSEMRMKSKSTQKLAQLPQHQNIGNFLKPTKIISATAHKWAIYDFYSAKYIRGYRARDSHDLSVFSKLLVFCAVNTIIQKFKLDMSRLEAIVTDGVLKLYGHNCLLQKDDIVSLQDLLCLMLMEENQVYETILAVNIGAFMQRRRKKEYHSVFDTKDKFMKEQLMQFYELVNSYCKLLKLENIRYIESDPSIRKQKNKCSASDVAILSIECLKMPLFMNIIRKLSHTVKVKYINQEGQLKEKDLVISNKTILNKYIPYSSVCRNQQQNNFMNSHCSIYYENDQSKVRPIVAVLLDCYGPHDREKDIQQLAEWYLKSGRHQLDIVDERGNVQVGQIREEIVNKKQSLEKSLVKLNSLNKIEPLLPKLSTAELQAKVTEKLNTMPQEQITDRYNHSIGPQNKSKGYRIKTLF